MCTRKEMLARSLGAPCLDDVMSHTITCSQHLVSTETRNKKQETKTDYTFSDGKIAKSLGLNQQKTKQNLNKCSTIFPCL